MIHLVFYEWYISMFVDIHVALLTFIVTLYGRDSGNDFVHFSVPFLEGRILDIRAACNYPTRNANFKNRISDFRLKLVSFLVSHFLCHS